MIINHKRLHVETDVSICKRVGQLLEKTLASRLNKPTEDYLLTCPVSHESYYLVGFLVEERPYNCLVPEVNLAPDARSNLREAQKHKVVFRTMYVFDRSMYQDAFVFFGQFGVKLRTMNPSFYIYDCLTCDTVLNLCQRIEYIHHVVTKLYMYDDFLNFARLELAGYVSEKYMAPTWNATQSSLCKIPI